jgi:hypothetical protein
LLYFEALELEAADWQKVAAVLAAYPQANVLHWQLVRVIIAALFWATPQTLQVERKNAGELGPKAPALTQTMLVESGLLESVVGLAFGDESSDVVALHHAAAYLKLFLNAVRLKMEVGLWGEVEEGGILSLSCATDR